MNNSVKKLQSTNKLGAFSKVVILTLLYILLVGTFAKRYLAEIMLVGSEKSLDLGQNIKALNQINQAIELNGKEPNYYKQRSKIYISSTVGTDEASNKTLKTEALHDLSYALELNPKNMATIRNTAPLYFFLANKDLSAPSTEENIDIDYLPITQEYLHQMQAYAEKDVGVQVLAAKYQKRLLLTDDYFYSMERIKSLRPDLLEWHPDLIQ